VSTPRACANGHLAHGYHTPLPSPDWLCDLCMAARYDNARASVLAYCAATNAGEPGDEFDIECAAIDLVADLMHYLDSLRLDPQHAIERGIEHYAIEANARQEGAS